MSPSWVNELRDATGRWSITSSASDHAATSIIRSTHGSHGREATNAVNTGRAYDTKRVHTDAQGRYSSERAKLHQAIIQHFLGDSRAQASPQALFTAGGAASGKSALAGRASDPMSNMSTPRGHVYVNADDIKKMLPEYHSLNDLGYPELSAAATHEESSDIAKVLTAVSMRQHRHLVIDGTGNSDVGKFGDKIRAAQASGYKVHARYAHIPVETAVERERLRAQQTGRKVDESVLRQQHRVVSQSFAEDVRTIPGVHIEVVSTLGRGRPTLIAEKQPRGQMRVANGQRYKELLDKAKA